MAQLQAKITERTLYPILIDMIKAAGGSGVSEVTYNSDPDIIFELGNRQWILSVKIGESVGIIKSAFIQYLRHKEESKIPFGLLLLFPENIRSVRPDQQILTNAVKKAKATVLIDAGDVKEELRDRAFPDILAFIQVEILDRLLKRATSYYSLKLVVSMLQQHVTEVMSQIKVSDTTLMRIVTDRKLLMDIGHLNRSQSEDVGRFLASYILLSQILFLRLFYAERHSIFTEPLIPISRRILSRAFEKVQEINYRPIYSVDVLDVIPDQFLEETFMLIWGLELERVRHDLPGRIFHELMPPIIRKMLAAFYTRPLAADLLSSLAIMTENQTIFDPACGSGTILVSAYKRKLELFNEAGHTGTPHKRYCESEIFGADIMPFAVHLTSANLAAMDVATTIERTQIIQGDSIELAPGKIYKGGIAQFDTFHKLYDKMPKGTTTKGDPYNIPLGQTDVVIMNPPFTKVERGVKRYVDMEKFESRCGGEVGLWGHFIALADEFLAEDGIFAAVIPINILRGRESDAVRNILFNEWTPLYIVKAVRNYGFSEWAEYRDILFIAKKKVSRNSTKVKFCLIKKDLTKLNQDDVPELANVIKRRSSIRSTNLDIDSHSKRAINDRFNNLMWFCGVTDFKYRDLLVSFIENFKGKLSKFPNGKGYCVTGFRPDKGVSKFLYITRSSDESRIEQAFLSFNSDHSSNISVTSLLGGQYSINKNQLSPSLRTPVGISTMDITKRWDYIVKNIYVDLPRVCRASNVKAPSQSFWDSLPNKIASIESHLVVCHRINPYSPATFQNAFYSDEKIAASDQMNIIKETRPEAARAICAILNSIIFWSQFMPSKEESTGRYINLRVYDLEEMLLVPAQKYISRLDDVYNDYRKVAFPSLRNQFDSQFEARYAEFWEEEQATSTQERLWSALKEPIRPASERLEFDLAVCQAMDIKVSPDELIAIYDGFVKEMIITRHLARD